MSKPSLKRQKKQKERQRQARQQRLVEQGRRRDWERRCRYLATYPAFRFDDKEGDPGFVKLVRKAVSQINFEDRTVFRKWEITAYQMVKQLGADQALANLREAMDGLEKNGDQKARFGEIHFAINLGQAVFDRIPRERLLAYLPFNDVRFVISGTHIEVVFRSLLHAKGSHGTIYYSRRQPTLDVDGQTKVVGFSRHAIERISERMCPRWTTYSGHGDVFAYFDQCVRFERRDLHDGQLAFTFYDACHDDRFWQYQYVQDVLGEDQVDPAKGKCYYRVGYCPAEIEGKFVVAKTLLFPGYLRTPEYGAIVHSSASQTERQELLEKSRHLDAAYLQQEDGLDIIRWFHQHGVPQVVQMSGTVFAPL